MTKFRLAAAILAISSVLSSCGGGGTTNHGLLQSITITPASPNSSAQFVATGTFADGTKVNHLPVNWFIALNSNDIDPAPGYSLGSAPFAQQCGAGMSGPFLVTAFAPQDPKAPVTGTMLASDWFALVTGASQNQGGFVGASAQLNCP
jgi:hypothetical protein